MEEIEARKRRTESVWTKRIESESTIDAAVQKIDPLKADSFLTEKLPNMNASGDVGSIAKEVDSFISSPDVLKQYNLVEARAALRDLGMIAASLRRHEKNVEEFPRLKEALIILSGKTNEVPRDTVFSYGPRNPSGQRQRRFTKRPEEIVFIQSFTDGMKGLNESVSFLTQLEHASLSSKDFEERCRKATNSFESMVLAMIEVRKGIPPEVFTFQLRPYFDPIEVDGKQYFAPGGAQMPVLLMDQMIWGSDSRDEQYLQYRNENLQYSPPAMRELATQYDGKPSLITRLSNELIPKNGKLSQEENASLEAVKYLLTRLLSFRMPHKQVADANFKLREGGSVGSGGYTPSLLADLIQHTMKALEKLKKINGSV